MIFIDLRDSSLLIRFKYNPDIVNMVKYVPGRRFIPMLKAWTVPFTKEIVEELPNYFKGEELIISPSVRNKIERLNNDCKITQELKDSNGKIDLPEDLEFPTTKPMLHQKTGIGLFLKRPQFAYFMEMGTGKTFIVLAGLSWLKKNNLVRPTLIVCPASVVHVWEDQAVQHQPSLEVVGLKGASSEKMLTLIKGYNDGKDIFIVNYESVWRLGELLEKIPFKCIVLDESTRIKNRTTKQTKACLKLGKNIPRRYILTGSPIPNSPLELYSQFQFLDPGILGNNFYSFRDRYCTMGGFQGYEVVGYKNLNELQNKLSSNSYRVLKKDCLDLPSKIYETIKVDLEEDQKDAYNQLRDEFITEVEGKQVTASVVIAKMTKLREILSGFIKSDDGIIRVFKKQAKLMVMEDLINDMPNNQKMVIWCIFREEMSLIVNLIKKLYAKENYVRLDGSVPVEDRGELIKKFQEGDARFFIGQQHTGGLGITLTAGSYCTFNTNDYSPETRLQAEDRLHRIGQKNSVTYYDIICNNTLDNTILRMLKNKQRLSELVTEKNLKEMVEGVYDNKELQDKNITM